MRIKFSDQAWDDYLFWQTRDRAVLKRINALIRDIQRSPFEGIGKPEPLKHNLAGFWSRRIDDEHRLVYGIDGDSLLIVQCRYHYWMARRSALKPRSKRVGSRAHQSEG